MNSPTHNRDAVLLAWREADARKDAAVAEERSLRAEAISASFGRLAFGVNAVELGNGWKLKGTNYPRYEVRKNAAGDYSHIPQYLAQLPSGIANSLIKWKAELNTSVYNSLSRDEQVIVNNFITIVDGSPQLEIVPPTS